MKVKIGHGFDAHRVVEERPLILGGIKIPWKYGLAGHSDADVLTHAVIDSLLGALSLGDIGKWFPDNDKQYKDANSLELLHNVLDSYDLRGWTLGNLDTTVVAQEPKLSDMTMKIRESLASTFDCPIDLISVKAKTTEKMGFCGRGEGIVAFANILMIREERDPFAGI